MAEKEENTSEPQLSLIVKIQELKTLSKEVECLYSLLFDANDSLGKVREDLREELKPIRNKLQSLYNEYLMKIADLVELLDDHFD